MKTGYISAQNKISLREAPKRAVGETSSVIELAPKTLLLILTDYSCELRVNFTRLNSGQQRWSFFGLGEAMPPKILDDGRVTLDFVQCRVRRGIEEQ